MPIRSWDSESYTGDEWFQELSERQRNLFMYLSLNDHCKGGLYYITLSTISNESKIPKEALPELLKSLNPKVIWYPDENLVWVKNFVKRQCNRNSDAFLRGVAKSLLTIRNEKVIREMLDYNKKRYGFDIPYDEYRAKKEAETKIKTSDKKEGTVPPENKSHKSILGVTIEK